MGRTYTLQPGASWLEAPKDSYTEHRDGTWSRVVVSPDGRSVTYLNG